MGLEYASMLHDFVMALMTVEMVILVLMKLKLFAVSIYISNHFRHIHYNNISHHMYVK